MPPIYIFYFCVCVHIDIHALLSYIQTVLVSLIIQLLTLHIVYLVLYPVMLKNTKMMIEIAGIEHTLPHAGIAFYFVCMPLN